jgi:DNA-binding IclR family transcriptional regulator
MSPAERPAGPRSILRVVQVLARLSEQPDGMTLSQLCQALSLPKTTVFTMLRVLEAARYLTLDDGLYRLGPQAVMLGAAMAHNPRRTFPDCAQGILKDLVRQTGETSLLAVLTPDRRHCRYVATVETDNWLRFSVEVGSLRPAYSTGSGRAMLAHLSANELRQALSSVRFERITPMTVASAEDLLAALRETRRRGVSVVDGGTVAGVVSVAAPILGERGRVAAAVTVGGPTARIAPQLDAVADAVCAAAFEISRMLGYPGKWPPKGAR